MATEKEAVLDRLRRQKIAEDMVDVERLRTEWLEALDALMTMFRGWLADAEKEGLFVVETEEIEREERQIGSYPVQVLRLTTPRGDVIRIVPRARHVVGAYGRVDLVCPPKTTILVRPEPGRWQVSRLMPKDGGWSNIDLSESLFWQVIGDLLS